MATVAGVRSNPVIKNFYTQLRARGKYPKSALTVCMRKLLAILNAMLHHKNSLANTCAPALHVFLFPLLRRGS
jgi:transposase